MDTKPYQRPFEIELSEDEWKSVAMEMALVQQELHEAEVAKATVVAEHNADIKGLKSQIATLTQQVRTKKADRILDVVDRPDNEALQVETVRIDNGDVMAVRRMTHEERLEARQQTLLKADVIPFEGRPAGGELEG